MDILKENYESFLKNCGYFPRPDLMAILQTLHAETLNERLLDRSYRDWRKSLEAPSKELETRAKEEGEIYEFLLDHYGYDCCPALVEALRGAHQKSLCESLAKRAFAQWSAEHRSRKTKERESRTPNKTEAEG